ncbi:MAG: amino acid permease [Candidatus Woesearchaeota archaeon]
MAKLKRTVTLFEATMYGLSVIIGAGIYALIGPAAGVAGNATWLAFLFAAFIAGCTGLSYCELSSKMPYDSAEYTYAVKSFGSKNLAFGIAWLKLISGIIAVSAVSLGFAGYFSELTGIGKIYGALLILLICFLVNLMSVQNSLMVNAFMVIVTILGLLVVIVSGVGYIGSIDYFDFSLGLNGIFTAAALIFFAFLGFEDIVVLGEESKEPKKVLPLAIMISIFATSLLYTLVSLVAISVVPWEALALSNSPLTLVAKITMGSNGAFIVSLLALIATGSTVFTLIFAYVRMIFGMAEKKSLPAIFLKLSRRGVPVLALVLVAFISAGFIMLEDIKFVASITDFGALFVFMAVNLSLIVLRYKHDHMHGQFKAPFNIGRFPVLAAVGAVFSFYMLTMLGWLVAAISIGLFLLGIILFLLFFDESK